MDRRWICGRLCGLAYKAPAGGEIGRRCLCGAGLDRDPRERLAEILASDMPLDSQVQEIQELLQRGQG